ncbi:M24 family metallopeptidase, partial [Nonlabens mediterrranea]|nr:M24 family metallopeptidase [Nonlabens mediterrranea]
MIVTKTREELEIMRRAALMVSKTLAMVAAEIKPGVTTLKLDTMAEEFIRDHGAIPGFKGLYDCPSTLLISPNEEVVHGIPKDVEIK